MRTSDVDNENCCNIFKQRSDLDDAPCELIILIHKTKGEIIRLGLIVLTSEGSKTQTFSFSPLHLQAPRPFKMTFNAEKLHLPISCKEALNMRSYAEMKSETV